MVHCCQTGETGCDGKNKPLIILIYLLLNSSINLVVTLHCPKIRNILYIFYQLNLLSTPIAKWSNFWRKNFFILVIHMELKTQYSLSIATAEIKEWNKFRKLLPILTCRGLPLGAKWILYFAYLPIAILYGYIL